MIDLLRRALDTLRDGLWSAFALLLDLLRGIGAGPSLALVAAAALAAVLTAIAMQRRLVAELTRAPRERVPWLRLELAFSLPGLLSAPFAATARLLRELQRRLARRGRGEPAAAPVSPKEPEPALLVATLGPSFLLSGLAVAALHLLSVALAPLVRAKLGLGPGHHVWQHLLIGDRPELGWYLPLQEHPYLAGLLSAGLWLTVWWWGARAVRFAAARRLGANLDRERDDPEVLPLWRIWCGADRLAAPAPSYRRWARWLAVAGGLLLAVAWTSLAGAPYRVDASHLGAACALWLAFSVNLVLAGLDRPVSKEGEVVLPEVAANGWPEVVRHLADEMQIGVPAPFRAPRAVEPLQLSTADPSTDGVLSPLVVELLPEPRRLTFMQRSVLSRLSLQAFVHLDPPVRRGELSLAGHAGAAVEDRSGLRSRNLVVVAPEGSGKSTLARLAAANHAVVHTRATLIVTRDERREVEAYDAFRAAVLPSTLRWNVRVRRFGGDLMADLSRGILPDVVVASLERVALDLLGGSDAFTPFLKSLGLVVVDDVESFVGPVEVHAQLAFRRLGLRVARATGVAELGEANAPQVLVLAADSMLDLPAWARSLCGIDAAHLPFGLDGREAREREIAELAAGGLRPVGAAEPAPTAAGGSEGGAEPAPGPAAEADDVVEAGRHQVFLRLGDFRAATGERIAVTALVEACERLAVPWHYRPCGDGRREQGRGPLLLKSEPKHHRDSPEEASVVLLEGPWSAVRREVDRLRRAGARFSRRPGAADPGPEPIALVTIVEPDEETAFTQLDKRFPLAADLDLLPRPIIRPPAGPALGGHVAAELTRSWIEVGEALEVFGSEVARTLRELARTGYLLAEERTDLDPQAERYRRQLWVRALASAGAEEAAVLAGVVADVEQVAERTVAVRDRTSLVELTRVDAAVAGILYYPGRIFGDARGRFVVVGRAAEEAGDVGEGDLLVEPLLVDDVSSPRRRFTVEPLAPVASERVGLGEQPIEVAVARIAVSVEHVETIRLAPATATVRQAIAVPDSSRETLVLTTEGLLVHLVELEDLAAARLLASVVRAVLPSLVRGAAEGLGVALVADPASGLRLVLFDLDSGGNGMARAVRRDGLELLLRLCRLLLERTLDPSRLLRLHDERGEDEPEAGAEPAMPLAVEEAPEDVSEDAPVEAEAPADPRRLLLAWLDSRLRPEWGEEAVPPGQAFGDEEPGEGDRFDLGRCWWIGEGADLADLLWAKHRWRLPDGSEASIDVGFDRRTVARARRLADRGALERYAAALAARLSAGREDGTAVWGTALPVVVAGPQGEARPSSLGLEEPALSGFQALVATLFVHDHRALGQLAITLKGRAGETADGLELATWLARFVQGIPYSVPRSAHGGLRPPVSTLLYRLGDCDSKSLLLAILLAHCGLEPGLFVSWKEGHALAGVALPAEAAPRAAQLWAEASGGRRYLPVETTAPAPVGVTRVDRPETWAFLPLDLNPDDLAIGEDETPSAWDRAELEGR